MPLPFFNNHLSKSSKMAKKPAKITLSELISINATDDAQELIAKYGVPEAKDYDDLINKIDNLIRKHGDVVVEDIAEIHPDRELIISVYESKNAKHAATDPGQSYPDCGKSKQIVVSESVPEHKTVEAISNAVGPTDKYKVMTAEYLPFVIFGSAALLTIAVVAAVVTKSSKS